MYLSKFIPSVEGNAFFLLHLFDYVRGIVWKLINGIWCRFSSEVLRMLVKLWSTLDLLLVCHTATQNPMYVLKEGNLRGLEERGTARASEFELLNTCLKHKLLTESVQVVLQLWFLFYVFFILPMDQLSLEFFICLLLFSYGYLFFLELKSVGFERALLGTLSIGAKTWFLNSFNPRFF